MDGLPAGALTAESYFNRPAGLSWRMPAGIRVSSIFRFSRFFVVIPGRAKARTRNLEIPGSALRAAPE